MAEHWKPPQVETTKCLGTDHMKRESTESDGDKPSTSSGNPDKGSKMAFEKTQKRVGKRPGRKPSKIDQKAKLERSRQSARECRARKKLRYQYLEELVASREKAVFTLRDEVEMFKRWCSDLDRGIIPERLLKLIAQEEMREATEQTTNTAQSKGSNPIGNPRDQASQGLQTSLTAMHRVSRSFEDSSSPPSLLLMRQRSDSAPNLAGTSSQDGRSMFTVQPSAGQSRGASGAGLTALVYQDFQPQMSVPQGTSAPSTTSFQPAGHGSRSSTTTAAVLQNLSTASWVMSSGSGQYTSRLTAMPRNTPSSAFGGSHPSLTQGSQRISGQGGSSSIPMMAQQTTSSSVSQSSGNIFTSGSGALPAGLAHPSSSTVIQTPMTISQGPIAPLVDTVVTSVPVMSTMRETVTTCPDSELTASISEPIPHWYSFLDDLESATFSARQGAFSGTNTPNSIGTPSSMRSNRSGPGTPASVDSPYSGSSQPIRRPQQSTSDAGNIPTVISDLLGHHSPS